jgi:hypothetical protein
MDAPAVWMGACAFSALPPVPLSRVISGPEELTICNTESFRG